MNRPIAVAATLLLAFCATFSSLAHAEEWRWCAAADINDDGLPNGPFLVTQPFRVDGAPDYQSQYEAYARSVMVTVQAEFMLTCSIPSPNWGAATSDRNDWLETISGLPISTMDIDWAPGGVSGNAMNASASTAAHDSTGALGERAYCMLQETNDGQPRALFSLVFAPPELGSDYDAAMANRFIRHAQELYGARPDAVATCHRHDTEEGAYSLRNHDAEMRRIKGWTVQMTTWSD